MRLQQRQGRGLAVFVSGIARQAATDFKGDERINSRAWRTFQVPQCELQRGIDTMCLGQTKRVLRGNGNGQRLRFRFTTW